MIEFNNKDIIKSKFLDKVIRNNKLSVDKKGNHFFVYHMFDNNKGWSGRWYNTKLTTNLFQWNNEKRQVTYIIPEWEIEKKDELVVIKNVPITITFNEHGWNDFYDLFHN